jgi:alpha-tubulin suppressor-like RCC1 family protein
VADEAAGKDDRPAQILPGVQWKKLAAGSRHTCGIRADGTLWCWGENNWRVLGSGDEPLGNSSNGHRPVQVARGTRWQSIAGGSMHTCGVQLDGSLWCWGANTDGQLGDGTEEPRRRPTRVGESSSWQEVSTGWRSTCATRTDGSLWCWGENNKGQLGDGTRINRLRPTRAGMANTWRSVDTKHHHTCGLQADGTLWCWGDNDKGQLGLDNVWSERPIRVPIL